MRIAGAKKGQQKFQIFKETTGLCLSICYYSVRFRSNLPVVSNLTAMNMWDATCMFFIYTSFLEFVVMNYLARYEEEEEHTLSRYNMKCSGENEILREYFMWYLVFLYISCYFAEILIPFLTVSNNARKMILIYTVRKVLAVFDLCN